jgi:hypothetical protein
MPKRKLIDRMPEEARNRIIARLRDEGVPTVDEFYDVLAEVLAAHGMGTSRSAAHRAMDDFAALAEDLRRERLVAESIVAEFGDEPDSRVARANIEMMHAIISKSMRNAETGGMAVFDPEETMFLANAMQKLASAEKLTVERIRQLEHRAAERARRAAAEALDAEVEKARSAGEKGFSFDTVLAIKERVLGPQAVARTEEAG